MGNRNYLIWQVESLAGKVFSFQAERGLTSPTSPITFMTRLQHFSLFLSENVRYLHRGAVYKTSIGIRNSAWEMSGVDEDKLQNLTYKTPQLYKDYGTLQTHPHLPPSIWEQKLKNETKHLWLSGSGSHRKTGKDWTPQLWSSTLSLLQKNCSLLPHVTWVCLRGTWVLLGRKAEQGKPCGYSCRLQRQDSQAPIACDVSCSNTEVGQEEKEDVQK